MGCTLCTGLRGIRVGGVAHFGLPSSSRLRRARRGVHTWEISSDDEPLVLGAVRNVAPMLMGFESVGVTQIDQESCGTVPPTVPATPGTLVEVGREPPIDQVPQRRGRRLVLVPMPGESPTWNRWRMVRDWEASATLRVW